MLRSARPSLKSDSRLRPRARKWLAAACAGLPLALGTLVSACPAAAQGVALPAELQHALYTKILASDRNLRGRTGGEIVIGIVFQPSFRTSRATKDDVLAAADASATRTIDGVPVRYVELPLGKPAALAADLIEKNVTVAYIAPLRAVDVRDVIAAADRARALTITGVPDYVRAGVAVGFDVKGNRPRILINLSAARACGADFRSDLLRIAEVVQ